MGFEAFVLAHNKLLNLNALYKNYFTRFSEDGARVSLARFHEFLLQQGVSFVYNAYACF